MRVVGGLHWGPYSVEAAVYPYMSIFLLRTTLLKIVQKSVGVGVQSERSGPLRYVNGTWILNPQRKMWVCGKITVPKIPNGIMKLLKQLQDTPNRDHNIGTYACKHVCARSRRNGSMQTDEREPCRSKHKYPLD